MPYSLIDFEKVDTRLLALIMSLDNIERQMVAFDVPGIQVFVKQIDEFRNHIACEIEKQGARE